jgi:hypothetical protein
MKLQTGNFKRFENRITPHEAVFKKSEKIIVKGAGQGRVFLVSSNLGPDLRYISNHMSFCGIPRHPIKEDNRESKE